MANQKKADGKIQIWLITRLLFRFFDIIRLPRILEPVWHLLTGVSRINEAEIEAAEKVFGSSQNMFNKARVAQGRLLGLVFRFNHHRSFVTFHTINYSKQRNDSPAHFSEIIHELTHVRQYEVIGSIYLWEALKAQWKWKADAYKYGTWQELVEKCNNGWHFKDFCREQQAKMAEDYFRNILSSNTPVSNDKKAAYEPFIAELRRGEM